MFYIVSSLNLQQRLTAPAVTLGFIHDTYSPANTSQKQTKLQQEKLDKNQQSRQVTEKPSMQRKHISRAAQKQPQNYLCLLCVSSMPDNA